jgi:inorganic pyrophosphatase/exopolyphosphatase
MKIVTSGLSFLDIDAYAGCIAYAELLNIQGEKAIPFSSANINESVTQTIRSWSTPLSTNYIPKPEDTFVLIDASNPEFLDKIVDVNRVEEVIDHHIGYEKFWDDKIESKSNIEFIGAACTQVYESWDKSGLLERMSETSARLLVSGILDNTLNFKAKVTTARDYEAYQELLKLANLPEDWTTQYFQECEKSIFADIKEALINDTKDMKFQNLNSDNITFGQLVIWDTNQAINKYRDVIEKTMTSKSNDWFVNIVSISTGQSLFLASNSKIIQWAEQLLGITFNERLACSDRLWLRKEIVKLDKSTGR